MRVGNEDVKSNWKQRSAQSQILGKTQIGRQSPLCGRDSEQCRIWVTREAFEYSCWERLQIEQKDLRSNLEWSRKVRRKEKRSAFVVGPAIFAWWDFLSYGVMSLSHNLSPFLFQMKNALLLRDHDLPDMSYS